MDAFKVLGIDQNATQADVKKAYRKLAKLFHPDIKGGNEKQFMIINEACYTLQEGTATIPDIDLGMKLGTSFPKGPFEWANLIGVSEVYHTLKAIYEDTKDERYKICPLLKTKHLKGERF